MVGKIGPQDAVAGEGISSEPREGPSPAQGAAVTSAPNVAHVEDDPPSPSYAETVGPDSMGGASPRPGEALSFAGRELLRALEARSLSQKALAEALDVSPAYVSAVVRGKKAVSAPTVEKVSAALSLDAVEARALHRAAARDHGFRLDLPDDW